MQLIFRGSCRGFQTKLKIRSRKVPFKHLADTKSSAETSSRGDYRSWCGSHARDSDRDGCGARIGCNDELGSFGAETTWPPVTAT